MKIEKNIKLAPLTTFKLGGLASFLCKINSIQTLKETISFAKEENLPIFVLGGGSNVLISDEGFKGLVLKIEMNSMSSSEEGDYIFLNVDAGFLWDKLVEFCVSKNWGGLENLSAIPGTVGAAPIQNIGAYGTEVSSYIDSVEVLNFETGEIETIQSSDCQFDYRHSLFKTPEGKKYIITKVNFVLPKKTEPNLSYKDLKEFFEDKDNPSVREIREAVIEIRSKKFPDLSKVGTAGSFFKNPIISKEKFEELKNKFPEIVSYPQENGKVKVSLGWVLDKIYNLKGFYSNGVGFFETQALVVVSKDNNLTKNILDLTNSIAEKIFNELGIKVEREVNLIKQKLSTHKYN
jgi:UDP-N-acetylmuramate dehydrogenase